MNFVPAPIEAQSKASDDPAKFNVYKAIAEDQEQQPIKRTSDSIGLYWSQPKPKPAAAAPDPNQINGLESNYSAHVNYVLDPLNWLDLNPFTFKSFNVAKAPGWKHDVIQTEVIKAHAKALRAAKNENRRKGLTIGWFNVALDPATLARRHTFFAFIRAVFYGTVGIWWQVLNNPTSLLSLGAVYSLFIYMAIFNVMLVAEVVLIIFDSLGGYALTDYISEKYGLGYTIVNWSLPQMFGDLKSIDYARTAMVKEPPKVDGTALDREDEIIFQLDICRTLLLMSSLVYERESRWIETANSFPQSAELLIPLSEAKITHIAKNWGMKFVSIADFGNLQGSTFCGIYYDWNLTEPWIVLAFKGTGPTNYAEWLVDCTIAHEDAGDYLWGYCHDGFYTQLFPSSEDSERVPYEHIISTIKLVSRHIRSAREAAGILEPTDKIHLYVTGHSLGAALASLCYARMLKCPDDLKSNVDPDVTLPIELRDGYMFGTPRVGNTKFADGFDACMNLPQNQHRTMWRVANDRDVVAHVPPGVGDLRSRRSAVRDNSLINYAAIGTYVNLSPRDPTGHPYSVDGYTKKPGRKFKIVQECPPPLSQIVLESPLVEVVPPATQPGPEPRFPFQLKNTKTPIGWQNLLGDLLIPKMNDHFTTGYYNSLQALAADDDEYHDPKHPSFPL